MYPVPEDGTFCPRSVSSLSREVTSDFRTAVRIHGACLVQFVDPWTVISSNRELFYYVGSRIASVSLTGKVSHKKNSFCAVGK